jgi:hypothetical protein
MNWVIILAIIIINGIAQSNPRLAGWLGVGLTTGILMWGLSIYSDPYGYIAFFGIPLSQGMFLFLIGLFYAHDAWLLYKAHQANLAATEASLQASEAGEITK